MPDIHISLARGEAWRLMCILTHEIFVHYLSNPSLDMQADAVPLTLDTNEALFTTNGVTV